MLAFSMTFGLVPLEFDPRAVSAPFTHDATLIALSMLVAVASSYGFLDLAERGRGKRRAARLVWMAGAGAMFGGGIWATHLIGMAALESPLKHGFIFEPTAISALAGIGCGCIAFMFASQKAKMWNLVAAGAFVGVGAIAMHYLGMRGMRMEATLTYLPAPVVATSIGAFAGSITALVLAHRIEHPWLRAAFAVPMGAVIAGLHYTDIAATIIAPRPDFAPASSTDDASVGFITFAVFALAWVAALALAHWDRRREALRGEAPEEVGDHIVVIPTPARTEGDAVIVLPERFRDAGRRR